MNLSFWSAEDRLFVPRLLGWSINFKFIARKLGWIKSVMSETEPDESNEPKLPSESREDRMRRAIERSRSENA